METEQDPRVLKVLQGKCWANNCTRVSAMREGFKKPWEDVEKPYLCTIHLSYNRKDTHYGTFDAKNSKWSCCNKTYEESECGEIEKILGPHKSKIKISPEQQRDYDERMRQMEARIESDFCSQNWDRS